MSPAPPVIAARPARWPFALLPVLLLAALWLLDTHQPAAWPDAGTPWFAQVRALSPATWPLDRLNAYATLAPDVPLGSVLVLIATVLCTLATLLAIDVPATVAFAVTIGLAGTRSFWSTVAPGQDALPLAVVACAVATLVRPIGALSAALPALAAIVCTPAATWLVLPASVASRSSARMRLALTLGVAVAAIGAQLYLLRETWTHVWCLAPAAWTSAIGDVLRPGLSADASPWLAVRQATAVFAGDIHLFGIAVAAFGLMHEVPRAPGLRRASIAALAVTLIVVAAGLLPPAFAAALMLPWWAPWFGVGLTELVLLAGRRERRVAMAFALALAALLPPLRHATVIPGPWRTGMPATMQAVSETWRGGLVANDDAGLTRRLRLAGATTVPADGRTLAACVASGRDVFVIGSMVSRVQALGHRVIERPLRPSLAAVIQDVRANQLVALAMAPQASSWAGHAGSAALARFGVARDTPASMAIGIVARTERGGDVRTGREGIDITWREGDVVAGRQLLAPVSVGAHEGDTRVDTPPARLAAGRQAAIAVFDRSHEPLLRGVASAAPGLPIALTNQADWRHALVRDPPRCVVASTRWTLLPASMSRLSVPVGGATPGNPTIVLLGSEQSPQVTTDGLPGDPLSEAVRVDVFDRQVPADAARLRTMQQRDEVPVDQPLRGRWMARIELRPGGPWHAMRASITPGVEPSGWFVRLTSAGSRPANVDVCNIVSGERLLLGQSGLVDDETAREVAVAQGQGWHAPERVRRDVFQWSAAATATATFVLEAPGPVVLALDAAGAATPAGRQALSVRVNDRLVSADWPGADRATLPVEAVRAGTNTITLSVPQTVQPGRDTRTLGVLVRQLRVIRPEGP